MGLLTAGGVLLQSTPVEQALFAPTPRMHGTYRGVNVERRYVNRFHLIGRFFAGQMPNQKGSILTYDIGVVGYITRFDIYDALGIVDPVIAHGPVPAGMGLAFPAREAGPRVFLLAPSHVRDVHRGAAVRSPPRGRTTRPISMRASAPSTS